MHEFARDPLPSRKYGASGDRVPLRRGRGLPRGPGREQPQGRGAELLLRRVFRSGRARPCSGSKSLPHAQHLSP